jgi:hypothetical protein
VDNLPEGYKDMTEFRKLFSKYVSPPYSQVHINTCTRKYSFFGRKYLFSLFWGLEELLGEKIRLFRGRG